MVENQDQYVKMEIVAMFQHLEVHKQELKVLKVIMREVRYQNNYVMK